MSEIGLRAARAIREMVDKNDTTQTRELERLKIASTQLFQYDHLIADPGAAVLQRMANSGYDVLYILTGERK